MTLARSASLALAAFASLGAVSAATTPAFAADDMRSRVVDYGDLDLQSRSGKARLDRRIDNAIDAVCAPNMARDLRAIAEAKKCEAAAKNRAEIAASAAVARQTRLAGAADTPRRLTPNTV